MNLLFRRPLLPAVASLGVALVVTAIPLQSAARYARCRQRTTITGGRAPWFSRSRGVRGPAGGRGAMSANQSTSTDARGRLWVTESVEYPFPAKDGVRHRDSIRICRTPRRRPGDEVTTFAEGLQHSIGVPLSRADRLQHSEHLRFRDSDGDSRADGREVLYQTYGYGDTTE